MPIAAQLPMGRVPFDDWFMGIRDHRQTGARIETHRPFGFRNFGNCASGREGVSELKIDFGRAIASYFGRDGDTLVILLSGGKKDTQDADMKLARQYWARIPRWLRKPEATKQDS